jgi:hypothetical protein
LRTSGRWGGVAGCKLHGCSLRVAAQVAGLQAGCEGADCASCKLQRAKGGHVQCPTARQCCAIVLWKIIMIQPQRQSLQVAGCGRHRRTSTPARGRADSQGAFVDFSMYSFHRLDPAPGHPRRRSRSRTPPPSVGHGKTDQVTPGRMQGLLFRWRTLALCRSFVLFSVGFMQARPLPGPATPGGFASGCRTCP